MPDRFPYRAFYLQFGGSEANDEIGIIIPIYYQQALRKKSFFFLVLPLFPSTSAIFLYIGSQHEDKQDWSFYRQNLLPLLRTQRFPAQQEYRLSRLEKQWLTPHVVILDELGYIPFSKTGAELLFQFCSARYERGSLIITSNLEFPKWTEVLGDEQMKIFSISLLITLIS